MVYFDMDGVLADFDLHAQNLTGIDWKRCDLSHAEKWKALKPFPDFFQTIPVMENATTMVASVIDRVGVENVGILGAVSLRNYPNSRQEKFQWLQKHFPSLWWTGRKMGATYVTHNIIIVDKAAMKQRYAKNGHILVDDNVKNIKEWNDSGGAGYLYADQSHATNVVRFCEMIKAVDPS